MLKRTDRVLLAVRDRKSAARNFIDLLGAQVARETTSAHLGVDRTVLAIGESEFELCQPVSNGPISRHIERWGEGLYAGGVSTADLGAMQKHLDAEKVRTVVEGDQVFLDPEQGFGAPIVVSQHRERPKAPGPVNYLYEFTNALNSDWRKASAYYTRIFGLDPSRFHPLNSHKWGYEGTLTLFNPPERLDRIELSETHDTNFAMGRFVAKRGDSLYMCFVDANNVPEIVERLQRAKARWTPRTPREASERHGLFVHPSALNGLLLGVSRRSLAWEWSGRPDLIEQLA